MAMTGAVTMTPGLDGRGLALVVRLPLQDDMEAA